jgi:hypothetical protein
MAFAVNSSNSVVTRRNRIRGVVSGASVAGISIVALAWTIATIGTMQTVITSSGPTTGILPKYALTPSAIALVRSHERVAQVVKYPRLPSFKNRQKQPDNLIADTSPVLRSPLIADAFAARALGIGSAKVESPTFKIARAVTPSPPVAMALVSIPVPGQAPLEQRPFDLVLADAVPLPATRPSRKGETKVPIATTRSNNGVGEMLAYASPDDNIIDHAPTYERKPMPLQGIRTGVAIYDISAQTVYLPNGERLEAHSGLGNMRDNPRYVAQKNRGPTPPHTYNLTMREKVFHGVEALRLTPLDGGNIFGRTGLLAHTYMLGAGGDSNGCVSFKEYRRFLAAFKRGEFTRLVVVPRLPSPPSRIASG